MDLCNFIHSDTIIVGHSLENDFFALKIIHNKIIDSSLIYKPRNSMKKNKLQHLTSRHLNRTIQTDATGHDSFEDAKAALDLVKLKFENGILFAMNAKRNQFCSIFTILAECHKKKSVLIAKPNVTNKVNFFC